MKKKIVRVLTVTAFALMVLAAWSVASGQSTSTLTVASSHGNVLVDSAASVQKTGQAEPLEALQPTHKTAAPDNLSPAQNPLPPDITDPNLASTSKPDPSPGQGSSPPKYILPDMSVWGERASMPFSARLDKQLAMRTPGTFSDPVRAAVWALPGVTQRDELFLRPSVNGGLPDWVSIYYGGFSDCYPYMLYGTLSIANGQFDQLRLIKGAFPVEYGDALSGVVLIEPKRNQAKDLSGSFLLDFVKSSLNISGPFKEYSYGLSFETSFYDKVLGPLRDQNYPGSYSVMSAISRRFGPRDVSLRTLYSFGGVDARLTPTADRYTSGLARSQTLKKRLDSPFKKLGQTQRTLRRPATFSTPRGTTLLTVLWEGTQASSVTFLPTFR